MAIIHKHIFKFPGSQDKKEMMDDEVFTADKRKHSNLPEDTFSGTKI